jgi:hypothetical protein
MRIICSVAARIDTIVVRRCPVTLVVTDEDWVICCEPGTRTG